LFPADFRDLKYFPLLLENALLLHRVELLMKASVQDPARWSNRTEYGILTTTQILNDKE
jgi:hypothetical protein